MRSSSKVSKEYAKFTEALGRVLHVSAGRPLQLGSIIASLSLNIERKNLGGASLLARFSRRGPPEQPTLFPPVRLSKGGWPRSRPRESALPLNVGRVTTGGCPTSRDFRDVGLPAACGESLIDQRFF